MNGKSRFSQRELWLGLLLVLATCSAYYPVRNAGFIWDDDYHVTANPCVVGPLGFKDIWTSSAAVYYPLVLTSFRLQHSLWGLHPLPYHVVTVLVHALCALLLWRLLLALKVRGAWLGAAIWSLHPVQVESAAWITELKNTQSCFFYLLAILLFLKWRRARLDSSESSQLPLYLLALVCALLAILSKASTVMLPVVICLCWWWTEGRWGWNRAAWLAPFFLVSGMASAWTIWEQKIHSGASGVEWSQSPAERIIIAGRVVWAYLDKLVWPHPLIFIYPRWVIAASRPLSYLPALAVVGLLAVLWLKRDTGLRPVFFAFSIFLISLFPVLGFFNVYFFRYSFYGDHFQYLASMGPLALGGAGIASAVARIKVPSLFLKPAACSVLLLVLGIFTAKECGKYLDNESLWRATLANNPEAVMAHNNLGLMLLEKGELNDAEQHFKKALEISPDFFDAHDSLGLVLLQRGEYSEAVGHFRRAIELKPDFSAAYNNLGSALSQLDRTAEAIALFHKALTLNPRLSLAYYNLGNTFVKLGRKGEAVDQFHKALELQPNNPDYLYNFGLALFQDGRPSDAIIQLRKAIALRPLFSDAQNNLGNLLLQTGQPEAALSAYEAALAASATNANAHQNLARLLVSKGEWDEAITHYKIAARLLPDSSAIPNPLAAALFQGGHTNEAMLQLKQHLALNPKDLISLRLLGQILSARGLAPEAVVQYEAALEQQPDDVVSLNNLAWLLATHPDSSVRAGDRAVFLAKKAAALSGNQNAVILGTLAAAYAEVGRFNDAVETTRLALSFPPASSTNTLHQEFLRRLADFQAGKPLRE